MGNRDRTAEAINQAAIKLFLKRGIAAVTMGEIALAAGITRRTLYRYYSKKEGLVYETVTDLLETWNEDLQSALPPARGKSLDRLGKFLLGMVDLLDEKRELLKLMGEFDFIFRDASEFQPAAETAARFAQASRASDDILDALIRAGQADGSVRKDVDPHVVVPTISVVLWGMAQRVAIRESHLREEFGLSGVELARQQILLYLAALAA